MASKRESVASKAQGKHPVEPSQQGACRKTRFDTVLFSSMEDYQQYKQHFSQRRVVPRRNNNFPQLQHFEFEGIFTRMGWLPMVTISEPISRTWCKHFTLGWLMVWMPLSFLLSEESRSIWTWRAFAAFFILLRLDSKCTSPRFGPLCLDLSLERSFRGFADLQTPKRWANPLPTTWPSLVECYTIWHALSFYHEADTEMMSLIMRHSLLTLFWLEDGSTWGTWWWWTWSHVARAWLMYSLMVASSLESSRMSVLTWEERQTLRPSTLMIRMMINRWGGWSLRRPPMVLGLGE